MDYFLQPITTEPELVMVKPPHLSAKAGTLLARVTDEIAQSPMGFDGEILLAGSVSRDRIEAFPASWSWQEARRRYPETFSPYYSGQIGAGIMLYKKDEGWLWQKRGDDILDPATWYLSVSGGLLPRQAIIEAAISESLEELQLGVPKMKRLEPIALRYGPGFSDGAFIIYAAEIVDEIEFRLEPEEVSHIAFHPLESAPLPQADHLKFIWSSLKPLLEEWRSKRI